MGIINVVIIRIVTIIFGNTKQDKITDATACICKLTHKHEHNLKKTELYLSIVTNVILI